MSNGHSSCSIWGVFLGFLTGVIWLLLAVLGIISTFFGYLGLGALGTYFKHPYCFNWLPCLSRLWILSIQKSMALMH